MNFLKIVTVLNWIVLAVLAFLVIAETLSPAKGGDAAGRGMGLAIYYLAIVALLVLLVLNLLPYAWARYTAFGLVAVPLLYFQIAPSISRFKRDIQNIAEESKPIFEDKIRDQLARVIRDGKPEKLKQLLQTPIPSLNEEGELLAYAVMEANHSSYRPAEKLECVRLLFQAGASLDSTRGYDVPIHMAVADVGNPGLLRMLLEQGADPNAVQIHFKRAIIFEAIASQNPDPTVRVLLDFGADPHVTAVFEEEKGPVPPLFRAAEMGRWGVCLALLEKGANPDFAAANGISFRSLVLEAGEDFPDDGYSKRTDFERLKKKLQ